MKRYFIAVLLCTFLSALQNAQATNRGVLYKVTGARHSMLLFGTIHEGLPEYYPLEPIITEAVKQAPVLALELDPKASSTISTLMAMMQLSSTIWTNS